MCDTTILSAKFNSPDIRFEKHHNGLVFIHISNKLATASLSLQGAHLISFQPQAQQPLLWLSEEVIFAQKKSIRGGIPICWPWFGPHPSNSALPAHGYARTHDWQLLRITSLPDGRTQLEFELGYSHESKQFFPAALQLRYTVTVGQSLELTLTTTNLSTSTITLSQALHTYFRVGDIEDVNIQGLDACEYIDKVNNDRHLVQHGNIKIGAEVDRIYLRTPRRMEICDSRLQRRICITSRGSQSAIVWNPWIEKSSRLGDMGHNGYRSMLCLETANADTAAIQLQPNAVHQLEAAYSVACL